MKLLNGKDTTGLILNAIKKELPFSMVRLGDGEFSIIKYPKYTKDNIFRARIRRWFNIDHIELSDLKLMREGILKACQNTDLLGIPSLGEIRKFPKWKGFNKYCTEYNIFHKNQKYFYFYDSGKINFKQILKHRDMVYCISCRDIADKITNNLAPNSNVINRLIPGEVFSYKGYAKNKDSTNCERHYPELYNKIIPWLQSLDLKGKVVLVGAGGLGKVYCNVVKNCGGVALDIGSLFDAWAGVDTRPYFSNVKKWKLKNV